VARSPEPDATDESLVAAARAGDVRAFEGLLLRHEARVLRVLRYLRVAPSDVEDVAQEVFIRVFRHLKGYRPGGSFEGWIYRMTVNAAHDHRRRRATDSGPEVPWTEAASGARDPHPGPAENADQAELKGRLEAALETLTERERAIFVLREIEGLETGAVARALGITSITVRRHLGLARGRLRRSFEAPPKEKERNR
jgi:RNA polymerase sigma-70 factor (ECF subfamily)